MHFEISELIKIQGMLENLLEPAIVDGVVCRFSPNPRAAIAIFRCEHFGECEVLKHLDTETNSISVEDLKTMSAIAHEELERAVNLSGWAAATDHPVDLGRTNVPEGFSLRFTAELEMA